MEIIKTSKFKYFNILSNIENIDDWRYYYDDYTTDEYSFMSPFHQRRSASYVFYLREYREGQAVNEIILEKSYIVRPHDVKKEELIKKYVKWSNEWLKLKNKK